MAQPFVVSIPHGLAVDEAQRRMDAAIGWLGANYGSTIAITRGDWSGGSMPLQAGALGYSIPGRIDVTPTAVTLTAEMPWLLQTMIAPFKDTFIAKARDHLRG